MHIYKLPKKIETLIFDIDSTLYTNQFYAQEQVDIQIRYFANLKGISCEEARDKIKFYRDEWFKQNGEKISLGNTLKAFGISIEESIKWREKLLKPENFLEKDERLIGILEILDKKYNLICVTNNPVLPAQKTLKALGIDNFFPKIIGLDTCKVSKPHEEPFNLACKYTNTKTEYCVSIGDRYDIDISLPLKMGMGGILVSGVEDVYTLPKII